MTLLVTGFGIVIVPLKNLSIDFDIDDISQGVVEVVAVVVSEVVVVFVV